MTQTTIYLVRHAQTIPQQGRGNFDWPLSATGAEQAEDLAVTLRGMNPDVLVSSPYPRALATLNPYALLEDMEIVTDEAFREKQTVIDYLPPADYQEVARKVWADPDYAMTGCESLRQCQERVLTGLTGLVQAHAGKTIAVCSHGMPIAAALKAYEPSFGYDDWSRIRFPDIFRLIYSGNQGSWDRDFKFTQ